MSAAATSANVSSVAGFTSGVPRPALALRYSPSIKRSVGIFMSQHFLIKPPEVFRRDRHRIRFMTRIGHRLLDELVQQLGFHAVIAQTAIQPKIRQELSDEGDRSLIGFRI